MGWSGRPAEKTGDDAESKGDSPGAKRITAKDSPEKLARRRFSVIELARRLGIVREASRRGGIDRTSFYEWKRRYQLLGSTV